MVQFMKLMQKGVGRLFSTAPNIFMKTYDPG